MATEGSLVHDADLLLSVFVIAMMMCMRSRVLHRRWRWEEAASCDVFQPCHLCWGPKTLVSYESKKMRVVLLYKSTTT